ncbi:MAG: 4-hydroxy-tetrahydrodipicolinate synthase [Bacteroidota bacterium]|nr:4-hydroxy-tetrahydrodipicolinate synthase [Bacteroidota bacterium]
MTSLRLNGLGTALVTPFTEENRVDAEAVRRLAQRQIDGGVDMLVPCGTTGEAVTLSEEEYEEVLRAVVEAAAGRVPVIAGAGSNSTEKTIETARRAASCGVDALLVVGPYYNKPTQEGYYQHFSAVAAAVDLPIVMYNVPGRTGGNIAAETQLRIATIENVVAVKEASGDLGQQYLVLRGRPEGFAVLSGDDNLVLPQIAAGLDGVISVVANETPEEFARMVHLAMDGDFDSAREIHFRLLDLLDGNFIESNPVPVKAAMAMMELCRPNVRLPLVPLRKDNGDRLRRILLALDLVRE